MAGGVFVDGGPVADYGGALTLPVILTCLMAASGGLIFGYDIGISGGVSQMESFLAKFFPEVLRRAATAKQNDYCLYDSQSLAAFTSSLYLAGLLASLVAATVTRAIGRQAVMLTGGALFFAGAALNAGAVDIAMLIIGRVLLGFGVGFTNQAAPLFLAEMSPARWRGAFTAGFQFFLALGVLIANLTNYGTQNIPGWGWRLSLGLAGAPGIIIVIGALFLTDTPASLVMRGKVDAARAALRRVRGTDADVDGELKNIIHNVEEASKSEDGAFRRLFTRRAYRPYLVMAIAIPFFFQQTGVVVIAFFAPLLFRIVGFGSNAALMAVVILGAVNLISVLSSALIVDRFGRRFLFLAGGAVMIVCQVALAWILGATIGWSGDGVIPKGDAVVVVLVTCLSTVGFGISWGPLGWVVPSEIFPVDLRSAGQAMNVSVILGMTFVNSQPFLAMLCSFKNFTFVYYGGWIVIMTAFIAFFLPETKGVPLESMSAVWAEHWFWKRFAAGEDGAGATDAP